MLLYVFMVAVFNLALGYLLATQARHYRESQADGPALKWPEFPGRAPEAPAASAKFESALDAAFDRASAVAVAADEAAAEAPSDTASPVAAAEVRVAEAAEATEAPSADAEAPPVNETPPPAVSAPQQAAIESLQEQNGDFREQLAVLDDVLRDFVKQVKEPEPAEVEQRLDELRTTSADYLEGRQPALDALDEAPGGTPAVARVSTAAERQLAEIATTGGAIERFDAAGDLREGCRVISNQTEKLIAATDEFQEALGEALAEEAGEPRSASAREIDPATGLPNRAAFEAELTRLWGDPQHRPEYLSLAQLNLDGFGDVSERLGAGPSDRLLRAIGELLTGEGPPTAFIARFAAESFAMLLPNVDIRESSSAVERIRQVLEKTRFMIKGEELRLTLSAGVVEACDGDANAAMFQRCEAALAEANRYGRNRTFFHEGNYPAPVMPPTFAIETRTVSL